MNNSKDTPRRITLVINKPDRETIIMNSLKSRIQEMSPETEVQIVHYVDAYFFYKVFAFKPNVIMTFPFTSVGLAKSFYIFKLIFSARIVTYITEGALNINSSDWAANFWIECSAGYDNYDYHLLDKQIFWGPKMAEIVGQSLIKKRKLKDERAISIAGNPRYEYLANNLPIPADLPMRIQEKLDQYPLDKRVFIITGFHFTDYSKEELYSARDLDADKNIDNLLKFVEASTILRKKFIEYILLLSKQNPDLLIIVKKHPIEKKEKYLQYFENLDNVLFVFESFDSQVFTSRAGLLVHYGSTVLMETYISRIPSIYVYTPETLAYYSNLSWPSTLEIDIRLLPESIAEFKAGKIKFTQSDIMSSVLQNFFNITPGSRYNPSEKIAAELLMPVVATSKLELLKTRQFYINFSRFAVWIFRNFISIKRKEILKRMRSLTS